MSKTKKLLLSILVVGAMGSFVAVGVFGLFSATTQNSGNEISAGTVALSDNDAGSSMFSVTGAQPGQSWTRCIKVAYHGTVPADVHLYMQNSSGPLAPYVNIEITQGNQATSTFPGCTAFTPDTTGVIFSGPAYSPVQGSWDYGLPVTPVGNAVWDQGESLVFRFTATLDPATPDSFQNSSIGTSTVVWEARNAA
jgi:hypothetical protein